MASDDANEELAKLRLQLDKMSKMATLGSLVAGVAHDVNTPLGSIKSNGEMAARLSERIRKRLVDPDPKLLRSLDALDKSVATLSLATERIRTIVDGLRKYSRDGQSEPQEADVRTLLDEALLLVSHGFEHRITAAKEYGDVQPIRCRADDLVVLFMNLLNNAVQAIEGEGTITVTSSETSDGVEIRIVDTGIGIAADTLERIFDDGFTTKDPAHGTGLGLSIARRIAAEHGGTLTAQSVLGSGTSMIVSLARG